MGTFKPGTNRPAFVFLAHREPPPAAGGLALGGRSARSQTRDAVKPLEAPILKVTTSINRSPSVDRLKRWS
jgi:hypothetical protein